jgi:hypothetical protein
MKFKMILSWLLIIILLISIDSFLNLAYLKASNLPYYLVLVRRNNEKSLYADFIAERQNNYNIVAKSLEELQVPNTKKGVLRALEKENPLLVVLGQGLIPDVPTMFFPQYVMGRITYNWLQQDFEKELLSGKAIGYPILHAPNAQICAGCVVPGAELSPSGEELKNIMGKDTITLYETRGDFKSQYTPIMSLNSNNFIEAYKRSSIVVATTTDEPLNHFDDFKATRYSNCETAIWTDVDKDGKSDNYNSEIRTEEFFNINHKCDGKKRILMFTVSEKIIMENVQFPEYCTLITYDGEKNLALIPVFIDNLKNGQYVGKTPTYEDVKERFLGISESNYRDFLTFTLYGPPETCWSDIVGQAKIEMKPLSLQRDREIDIPLKEGYINFSIENVGSQKINFQFSENGFLEITPMSGIIAIGQSLTIKITVKRGDIKLLSTLKKKHTMLQFLSNAGNVSIRVNWYGV